MAKIEITETGLVSSGEMPARAIGTRNGPTRDQVGDQEAHAEAQEAQGEFIPLRMIVLVPPKMRASLPKNPAGSPTSGCRR